MVDLIIILEQIQGGKDDFRPEGNTREDLENFQPTAKAIMYAHRKGYLEDCHPIFENVTTKRFYAAVLLRGGLSHEGEMHLNNYNEQPQSNTVKSKPVEDIVEIKPNFYGIGINFNAVWRKLFRN
jgi:hypothetical protein